MGTSYNGALDFLEDGNQSVFNFVFGDSSTPLSLSRAKKMEDTVEEIASLCEKLTLSLLFVIYLFIVVLYTDAISERLIIIAYRS